MLRRQQTAKSPNKAPPRGHILLSVMAMGLTMGLLLMGLSLMSNTANQLKLNSADMLRYKTVLSSMTEMAKFALKNRWCVTEVFQEDPNLKPPAARPPDWQPKCAFYATSSNYPAHPRNLGKFFLDEQGAQAVNDYYNQRFKALGKNTVLSGQNVRYINDSAILSDAEKMHFALLIQTSDMTVHHPLFEILNLLPEKMRPQWLHVDIQPVNSLNLPRQNREVYLRIKVTMDTSGKKANWIGQKVAQLSNVGAPPPPPTQGVWMETVVGFYPRQLDSFGLIVSHNLILDNDPTVQKVDGDIVIPQPGSGSQGKLVFDSPIYVNGNVVLPPPGSSQFTPVTFNETVFLGSGGVQYWDDKSSKMTEWRQQSLGAATNRFFSQNPTFGGFLKGVSLDGKPDDGLQTLYNLTSYTAPDASLALRCQDRYVSYNYLYATRDSGLMARKEADPTVNPTAGHDWKYRLGLNGLNRFQAQDAPGTPVIGVVFPSGNHVFGGATTAPTAKFTPGSRPIALVEISVDLPANYRDNNSETLDGPPNLNEFILNNARTQTVKVWMGFDTKATIPIYLDRRKYTLADQAAMLAYAQQRLNNAPANKKKHWQDVLNAIPANFALPEVQAFAGALAAFPATAQPAIVVETDSFFSAASAQPSASGIRQPNQLSFKISTVNERLLPPGMSAPRIKVLAMDLGTDRSGNTRRIAPENQTVFSLEGMFYLERNADFSFKPSAPANPVTVNPPFKNNGSPWFFADTTKGEIFSLPVETSLQSSVAFNRVPRDDTDWVSWVDIPCDAVGTTIDVKSFGTGDVYSSFAASAALMWNSYGSQLSDKENFINQYSANQNINYNISELHFNSATNTEFFARAVVDKCIIHASARYVQGLLVCNELQFDSRSRWLRIIGTIVTKRITGDFKSAVGAGIEWSSMYYPGAIQELRARGILKVPPPPNTPAIGGNPKVSAWTCNSLPNKSGLPTPPLWDPGMGLQLMAANYACSPASLTDQAPNFRWTTIDPDCYLDPTAGSVRPACRYQINRFLMKEIMRRDNL